MFWNLNPSLQHPNVFCPWAVHVHCLPIQGGSYIYMYICIYINKFLAFLPTSPYLLLCLGNLMSPFVDIGDFARFARSQWILNDRCTPISKHVVGPDIRYLNFHDEQLPKTCSYKFHEMSMRFYHSIWLVCNTINSNSNIFGDMLQSAVSIKAFFQRVSIVQRDVPFLLSECQVVVGACGLQCLPGRVAHRSWGSGTRYLASRVTKKCKGWQG